MNTEWLLAKALKYLMDKTSSLVNNNEVTVFGKCKNSYYFQSISLKLNAHRAATYVYP